MPAARMGAISLEPPPVEDAIGLLTDGVDDGAWPPDPDVWLVDELDP